MANSTALVPRLTSDRRPQVDALFPQPPSPAFGVEPCRFSGAPLQVPDPASHEGQLSRALPRGQPRIQLRLDHLAHLVDRPPTKTRCPRSDRRASPARLAEHVLQLSSYGVAALVQVADDGAGKGSPCARCVLCSTS